MFCYTQNTWQLQRLWPSTIFQSVVIFFLLSQILITFLLKLVFIGYAFSDLISFNNMSLSAGFPKFYPVFHCFSVYVIPIIHFCSITVISALIIIFSADEIKLLLQIIYAPAAIHQSFIFFLQSCFHIFPPILWSWQAFLFISEILLDYII